MRSVHLLTRLPEGCVYLEVGKPAQGGYAKMSALSALIESTLACPDFRRVGDRPVVEAAERLAQGFAERGQRVLVTDRRGRQENDAWAGLVFRSATAQLMGAGLARGVQTRDGEQDLEGLFRDLT